MFPKNPKNLLHNDYTQYWLRAKNIWKPIYVYHIFWNRDANRDANEKKKKTIPLTITVPVPNHIDRVDGNVSIVISSHSRLSRCHCSADHSVYLKNDDQCFQYAQRPNWTTFQTLFSRIIKKLHENIWINYIESETSVMAKGLGSLVSNSKVRGSIPTPKCQSHNSAIPNFTLHNIAPLITLANTIQILQCGGQAITKLERDNLLSLWCFILMRPARGWHESLNQ